ncbi:cohesin domain-containing protein [Cellulomonas telluris]|uniref:cohesin domain-containing protein n=1 Tax=Cellulomonas telluris TaxID=2306636 RepID=UPI0010A79697|nr:cohesin domain-containing protein [Cellulomonas telluris]
MRDRTPRSRSRRGALRAAVVALGLTLATAGTAAAAPTVDGVALDATPEVTAGGTVDVRLDLRAVTDVYAYEATLAFDPDLLAFEAVTATPDGGFDDATAATGTVTVRHTRLGTSPGLTGDVPTTTLRLRALGAGTAAVTARTVALVGTDGAAATLTDAATATVVVAAAPVPPASPAPTPTPSPTTSPTTSPVPEDAVAAPGAPTPTPSAAAAVRGPRAGSLGATGADVAGLVALAAAAAAVGAFLVRRRVVSAR